MAKITQEEVVEKDLWKNTIDSTKALITQVGLLETALSKAATIAKEKLGLADDKDFNSLKKSNEQIDILNKALAAKIKLEKESAGLKASLVKLQAQEAAAEKKAIDEVAKKRKKAKDDRLKDAEKILADKKKKTAEVKKLAEEEAAAEKKALEKTSKERAENNKKGLAGAKQRIAAKLKETKQRIASDKREVASQKRATKESERAAKEEVLLRNARVKSVDKSIKAAQKERKSTLDNANAFKRLSKQVNNAQARFKRLAAQYGENDKRTRKALKTFNKLDNQLRSINQTARDGRRDVGRYGTAFSGLGTSFKNILRGLVIVQGIRAIGNALRDAARRVVEFDKELQNIAGITGQTRESLKDLEKSILNVSRTSIKSANEVAKLATVLFTLGKTKEEVKLLLAPVNNLSIAFGVNADAAADFLGQTLNAFGKGAEFASNFADIIANVRTSTSLDFERIKDGLGFLAPTASALNLTLGETSALLGVLQDNGVRAARAGRLLNSSFARIIDRGLSLDDALEQINESQNKIATSSELFGKEALALGLILADNTEKTAELSNEFDNLSDGSLKELTDKQLDSLSAKITLLDSNWEALIVTIENGTGGLAKFFKAATIGLTDIVNNIRRANQEFQDNLREDVEDANSEFISNLNRQISENINAKEKEKDKLIEIEQSKLDRQIISQTDFNKEKERLEKEFNIFKDGASEEEVVRRKKDRDKELDEENRKFRAKEQSKKETLANQKAIEDSYLKSIEGARNAALRKQRDELTELVKQQSEGIGIKPEDAAKELEILVKKQIELKKQIDTQNRLQTKLSLTAKIEDNIDDSSQTTLDNIILQLDQIEQINLLLKQREEIEPFVAFTTDDGTGKTKEVVGLINKQAEEVQRLTEAVNAAKIEGGSDKAIKELGDELFKAKVELDRLQRIAFATREEFEKQQIDLIEDRIDKEIAAEVLKSEKLRDLIKSNNTASEEEQDELIKQEKKRIRKFIKEKELERRNIEIEENKNLQLDKFKQTKAVWDTEVNFAEKVAEKKRELEIKALQEQIQARKDILGEVIEEELESQIANEIVLSEARKKAIAESTDLNLQEKIKALAEESENIKWIINDLEDAITSGSTAEIEALQARLAAYTKLGEERVKLEVDIIALLEALNEKYFSDQLDKLDRQISDLEKRESNLQDLANRGNEEAASSLAQSQKDQAEAAKKREDLLQREKQFEFALAVIGAFNTALERPGATTSTALTEAITSTTVLTSFVQSLPSFFDGTTDTGNNGSLDSNGGHLALLHDNERVVDKKNNMKMGGVTNEDAANIVHDFNNDLLSYNTPQLVMKENRFDSTEQILSKFDQLSKDVVSAINNKETYLGSDIDTIKKMIIQDYSKGGTRTKVKSKYPTRR